MKKLIAILMAACMLLGSMTAFAAKGDFTVKTNNPSQERIFYFNFNEGYGSGVNDDGNLESNRLTKDHGQYTFDTTNKYLVGNSGSTCLIALGYGQYGAVSKPLDAGWYRVDFDIQSLGTADFALVYAGLKTKANNTVSDADAAWACDTFDNLTQNNGRIHDLNSERWRVMAYPGKMTSTSLYFKADGTKYWMLENYCGTKFAIDNVALYKVGEATDAAPTIGLMKDADMAGKEIKVTSELTNNTSSHIPVTLINAVYDTDNNLVDVDFKSVETVYGNHGVHPDANVLDLTGEQTTAGYSLKTYVWDGMELINPYTEEVDVLNDSKIVAHWDFEDGTVQGFENILASNLEVQTGIGYSGSKYLKVTSHTDNITEYAREYTGFRSPELSNILNTYGPGQYKLTFAYRKAMGANAVIGNVAQVDVAAAYIDYWGTGSIHTYDAYRTKVTPSLSTNTQYGTYLYSFNPTYTVQWGTAEIIFNLDTNYANQSTVITFRNAEYADGDNVWFIDDIKLEKVN